MRVDGHTMGLLMDKKTASVRVSGASDLLVNPDHAGYYSVLYDAPRYERLAEGFASLDPHDKGGLMNDLFLFLQAGEVDPALYFKFVRLCGGVGDHLVVQTVSDQLSYLNSIAGEARSVSEYRLGFLTSQMQRLGLSPARGEDDSQKDDRETVASELATADQDFAEKLAGRFDNYASVEPDMRGAVAIAYVMAKGKAAYGPLSEMVKREDVEEERSRLYRALTSFNDPRCVIKTMDLAMGGEVSRSDTGYALLYAALNPYARNALCDWIVKRFERLWEIYGGSQQVFIYLDAVVPRCGLGREKEVRVFLNRRMKEHGGITFKRTLERLRVNSRLRSKLLSGS